MILQLGKQKLRYSMFILLPMVGILTGCLVGPTYKRPVVDAPPVFRDANPESSDAASAGDRAWSEVFHDETLKTLIAEAIRNNYDVRIAAQRIVEQQARVGLKHAQSLPTLEGKAGYSEIGFPAGLMGNPSSSFHGGDLAASASWSLDFWGLYRRQTEAARALLLATEWGQRAAKSAIVAEVSAAYIQLRSLDSQQRILRAIAVDRGETLRLMRLRESVGSSAMPDVRQAEQSYYAAEASLPKIALQIREQENDLSFLVGRNPAPIVRDPAGLAWLEPQELPAGLPSQLLERRSDIQQAEARLIAANAEIGVARAQFFPQIALTGMGGTATSQLSKLFSSSSNYWLAAANLSQPIFSGGKLRNNLKLAEATQQELTLAYQKTISAAFRDVANALAFRQHSRADRLAQEKEVDAARAFDDLARIRYGGGRISYLEVLASDNNLHVAQLSLADAQQRELLSVVQLYEALGGGWK